MPRTKDLSPQLASVAREIASRLRSAQKQAWIVGGTVRDLALGLTPCDLDFATDAHPDEIERLFESTIPVGRAFGTILVRWNGIDCEVTTFRSESRYSDARHPEGVEFSASVEEDVLRRDFTCNALYLDPLEDRLLDPTGGIEDLAAGRLRCVGDPGPRFQEDALRVMRLARFVAYPGLDPTPETKAAASAHAERLQLVAPERRLRELLSILARPGIPRALECLWEIGALRWAVFAGDEELAGQCHDRMALFRDQERLPTIWGAEGALSVLFGTYLPDGDWPARLKALRPSRELMQGVEAVGSGVRELEELVQLGPRAARSRRVRVFRAPRYEASMALAQARARTAASDERQSGAELAALEALARERDGIGAAGLQPELWLTSSDLAKAGLARGPAWGSLLHEAETCQLDGDFTSREEALEWLHTRIQDGGNSPRNSQDAG